MSGQEISCEILLPVYAQTPEFGRFFWSSVREHYPDLMPGRYGSCEPLPHVYSGDNLNELVGDDWCKWHMFIWRPKAGKLEGIWCMSNGRGHSSMFLYGAMARICITSLVQLYRYLTNTVRVDLAFIHCRSRREFDATRTWNKQMYHAFNSGTSPVELKQYLPNVPWGMFLGKPYVDLIGADVIASVPAHRVERWNEGYYFETTENISDVYTDYDQFEVVRDRIKEHLGREYFFDPNDPRREYRAPEFVFGQ